MFSLPLNTLLNKLAVLAGVLFLSAFLLFGLNWGISNSAATRADSRELAEALVGWSPSDPQTHYAAAVFAARDQNDEGRKASLAGFETAVALAPRNYLIWTEYGRALERAGETDRATLAFDRASELAPNYSSVAWARGNFLVRQGRVDAGFVEIRRAIKGTPSYAPAAAQLAWVSSGLNAERAVQFAGNDPSLAAALALVLARAGDLDRASELWRRVPGELRKTDLKDTGLQLARLFFEGGRYRDALDVEAGSLGKVSSVGSFRDPGFEEPIATENAGLFDWKLDGGTNPSMNLFDTVKRSGKYSLFLRFARAGDQQSLRQLSQAVAVEPGATYRFVYRYRAELSTSPDIRWSVAAIRSMEALADGPPLRTNSDWAEESLSFVVPGYTDGVTITLRRDACTGTPCRTDGNLWLDDLELVREN